MSKVWFVTGAAGGFGACGLTFLQTRRASAQDSIAKEHS